jgi:hypothetical protein
MRTASAAITGFCLALLATASGASERCALIVDSRPGGSVNVDTGIVRPGAPPGGGTAVGWRPPSTGSNPMLSLYYRDGSLSGFGPPSGAVLMIRLPKPPPRHVTFTVKIGRNSWSVAGQNTDLAPSMPEHDYRSRAFVDDSSAAGFAAAARTAAAISVTAEAEGGALASTTFDLSNPRARDALLSRAKAQLDLARSPYCSPDNSATPTEWQYWCRDSGGRNCPRPVAPSRPLTVSPVN